MFQFRSNRESTATHVIKRANYNAYILRNAQLYAQRIVSTLHAGYYKSFFTNSGLDYNYSRSYVFGDDIRHIDWNVTARLQNTYVKSFIENRDRVLWLVCDVSASMEIGAPRSLQTLSAEIAATLLFLAHAYNDKTGAIIFSQNIHEIFKIRKSSDVVSKIVSCIMQERSDNCKSSIHDALACTKSVLSQRSLVVIISDFLNQKLESSISFVSDVHDVLLIRVVYDMHKMLPVRGGGKMRDTEDTNYGIYSFKDLRNIYKRSDELNIKRWQSFCKRSGVRAMDICTTDSVLHKLVTYMKNKKLSKVSSHFIV